MRFGGYCYCPDWAVETQVVNEVGRRKSAQRLNPVAASAIITVIPTVDKAGDSMNIDQKLTAIRDIIQQDIGNRGLARDPHDNLLTATRKDFANACHDLAARPNPGLVIQTGFVIPWAMPLAAETDGPLGSVFLVNALRHAGISTVSIAEISCLKALLAGIETARMNWTQVQIPDLVEGKRQKEILVSGVDSPAEFQPTCLLAVERVGPAQDGRCYTMRGVDATNYMRNIRRQFEKPTRLMTIGIGDGGNEIGMGKIPHETIVKNIPNGDLIHCRVPTDHLIVAGVSNWGAYGLAAGVALLRGVKLPDELFDPDREREILQIMVDAGPLVDGVTGQQTATVDGLSWDDYIKPLVEIGRIVKSSP